LVFLARTRKNAGTDAGVAGPTDPVGTPGHSTGAPAALGRD
jgi:hypothetical protein